MQIATSTVLRVLTPEPLMAAVRTVAEREMRTVSDFTRAALLEKVRAAGIDPTRPINLGETNVAA